MAKIPLAVNTDKRNLRDAVTQAVTDIDDIIANFDTVNVRQAIRKLAQHQRTIIKRLVQL